MKNGSSLNVRNRENHAQYARKGCTLIEMLMVVALISIICVGALRSVAGQQKTLKATESEFVVTQEREACEWMLIEIQEGSRVWIRQT